MPPPTGSRADGVADFVIATSTVGAGVVGGDVEDGGVCVWVGATVFVTVTVTAADSEPLLTVAGLPEIDGAPNVQPFGADGSDGSLTVHWVPASNGPTVADSPPCSATDCCGDEPHV